MERLCWPMCRAEADLSFVDAARATFVHNYYATLSVVVASDRASRSGGITLTRAESCYLEVIFIIIHC